MPTKKYKPEEIVSLLRQIEVAVANGKGHAAGVPRRGDHRPDNSRPLPTRSDLLAFSSAFGVLKRPDSGESLWSQSSASATENAAAC